VRWVVWLYLSYFARRLRNLDHPFKELRTAKKIIASRHDKLSRVADKTDAANEQHYEVPTDFFTGHLGPCRKYSSCEWEGCATLGEAETASFDSYLEKMGIATVPTDGSGTVLEVGCGWGSFLLYSAAKHPAVKFVGFSNSATQRAHVAEEASRRRLHNVTVLRLDINDFCEAGSLPPIASNAVAATAAAAAAADALKPLVAVASLEADATATATATAVSLTGAEAAAARVVPDLSELKFDRIFSCECLEHSRDYGKAFEAMSKVLKNEGKVFVQILCHREYTYFMNSDDWMGRNFFTGGTIPSTKFFLLFTEHLVVDESWYLPGTLYARTLDAWLEAMHAAKAQLTRVFEKNGYKNPAYEFQKWRMFYLMSSVSFGFNGGNEWMVAYYTMSKRAK